MRNLVFISLAFATLFFASCDKVNNPFITKQGGHVILSVPPSHVDSTTMTSDTTVKILVEDYTAHLCTNCPRAAKECDLLFNQYPSHVVFMEVNSDATLGAPNTVGEIGGGAVDSAFLVDYRATAGNNWNAQFINSGANGMPGTMVNRLYYNGNGSAGGDLFLQGTDVSIPGDSLIMKNTHLATIHIADSMYLPPTSAVSMTVTANILNPVIGNKYYLVVALVEDSIFDWQDSVGVDKPHYLKRMTFRGTINDGGTGTGDSLMANSLPQAKHYTYANVANFKYNSAIITNPTAYEGKQWNMAHMYVVAFVYQVTTGANNYMVLQAQLLHL